MTNCNNNFGIQYLSNQELAKKLENHAKYYWDYWDLEGLHLVKEDTAQLLYEASKRLKQVQ